MSKSRCVLLAALPLALACSRAQPSPSHGQTSSEIHSLVAWPRATENRVVERTIQVSVDFDGGMARFQGAAALGTGDQDEHQAPLFELEHGAVLANVILGAPAADGVHCKGSCTLKNVWWEDVGEDAATFLGRTPLDTMRIEGGGARAAEDKVFQHNGLGTVYIKGFYVESFGKLFRSCGNCSLQVDRHVVVENLTAVADEHTAALVGLNSNYGDTAEFLGNNLIHTASAALPVCLLFEGNALGAEPRRLGAAVDSGACKNLDTNVHLEQASTQ
jgi:pectate lyase